MYKSWLEPFDCETVFMVFGLTRTKPVCLGTFEDAEEAYAFAADQVAGIVVPGTAVRRKSVSEDWPLQMTLAKQKSTEKESLDA